MCAGPYGTYFQANGARIGGVPFEKFTAKAKHLTVAGATLADAAPGLIKRYRKEHDLQAKTWDAQKRLALSPPFEVFEAEISRAAGIKIARSSETESSVSAVTGATRWRKAV